MRASPKSTGSKSRRLSLVRWVGFIQSVERPNKQNQGDESNHIRVIVLQQQNTMKRGKEVIEMTDHGLKQDAKEART